MVFRSLVLITTFVQAIVNGANILYLNRVTSPSHHFWNSALANGLAARGHNVTFVSPDPNENSKAKKGIHNITLEGMYNSEYFESLNLWFDPSFSGGYKFLELKNFLDYFHEACEKTIQTKGFRTLMEYPDDFRFDLIVHDVTAGACLLGFVHKFKYPPLVQVSAYSHPSYLTASIGGHQYYSYAPHVLLNYDDDMNIFQRLYNFALYNFELLYHDQFLNRKLDTLLRSKFGPSLPTMTELQQRTALAFVNTNSAFDNNIPLPENVIPVAGLQIKDTKPLPPDLENFIMSAEKGAVLFSLGSNIRSSLMDLKKQKMLIDAFEQFPDYHFLWKFEESSIDIRLPTNVIIRPWLPQSDILAHSKIKAFITHSGLLSAHEAIWRGVPMIGMPFGIDQNGNLLKSIRHGFAERIDFHTMTTDIVKDTLQKVLEDTKYYENAKRFSARFRDQKEKPLERAVWWIEWLLRNPDCDHLKSPVLRLGFIVGNSYDIIIIISFVAFIILVTINKVCLLRSPRKIGLNAPRNCKKIQ